MENKTLNLRWFCKNIELDDRIKDYIVKRIQKMEKFLKKSLEYEVEVSMDKKGKFYVEVMIKTPYKLYRATEISESVEGSTDMIIEDLQKQITKDKSKLKDIRERGARSLKKKIVISKDARF
ncbi:MAG: Ribosomal subunit interface protein [Candidatus Moranbacteria bacterium GW2011_GWF2_36_839]|nr:MAG: Ribosomal subunit interface protein [Candidatus Moranbacteria bacterium GW2011_GWF1_36_78]KKQ16533.1 MAG: Ribosomal subunit interface protein [Candidatus Moranbacteria bacterium GW2011_GWF2_36_839]HAT73502.1 ribosome-associated translation inhibitor RaiA [Candidatus Moranbacteria bacterium]HBY10864.1 ribosome-associated translation inhibitor RaiA [Candidatus Moranbacteria bacterium]